MLAWRLYSGSLASALLLASWIAFLLGGMLLAGVDVAVHRLPTPVLYATTAGAAVPLAATALIAGPSHYLVGALLGSLAVCGFYLVMAMLGAGQIGMGDVRLAGLAGLMLGSIGWSAVLLGTLLPFLLALPLAVVRAVRSRGGEDGGQRSRFLAFGPFLVAGALAAAIVIG
jgi:leader peptidase (prepilin peptidase) / N-methyltransferase